MEEDFSLVPSFQNTAGEDSDIESIDLPRVISLCSSAVRKDPNSPFLSFALGEGHRLKGDSSEADRHYELALEKTRGLGEHLLLIELFEERGLDLWMEKAKEQLVELKLDMGITSLPLLSAHFRKKGLDFLKEGDEERARAAFMFARRLDPSRIENYLPLLRLNIGERKLREALEIATSMVPCLTDLHNQSVIFSSVFLLLCLAIPLALAAGIWGFVFRHIPPIQHRVFECLPNRLPSTPRAVTAWTIIALPFLWGFPVFLLTLSVIALVWVLFSRRERLLVLLLLLILVASPLLLTAFDLLRTPVDPASQLYLLSQVQKSGWERELEERLAALLEERGEDFDLSFALGLLRKRRGDFALAKEAYEAALLLDPGSSVVHNNLGNVYFATGDYEKAAETYTRANQLDPESAVAHYNLAQVYREILKFRESTDELAEASRLDFHLVRTSTETSSDHFNRAVVDAVLPPLFFWRKIFRQPWRWEALTRSPFRNLSLSAAVWFFVLILLGSCVKGRELGQRCSLCGRPICVKCREKFEQQPVCPFCEWKVSAAKSENVQERLVMAIPRRSGILARVEAGILGLIYPGTGHLFLGAVGRGIFFSLLASLLVSHLFLVDLALGRPPLSSLGNLSPHKTLLMVILGLTWIWSMISVFRRKERPWLLREI